MLLNLLTNSWILCLEMAPYLMIGFIVAGLIHVLIPINLISRHLGKHSFFSVLKSALFGIPIPICSCGVLPVAKGIKKSGASKPATLSFLITTPASGIDSILATGALLGWFFALIRTVFTFLIGLTAGTVSLYTAKEIDPEKTIHNKKKTEIKRPTGKKIRDIFEYAFIDLPKGFSGSLLLGLLLGGFISTIIPPQTIQQYLGSGIWGILVATLIAIPMYVCATGSIPIAVALVTAGFSPGAALAFLIAGPATNTVAIVTVKNILDKKNLIIYLLVIFTGAIASGILLDLFEIKLMINNLSHQHQMEGSMFKKLCGILLLSNILFLFLKKQIARIKK